MRGLSARWAFLLLLAARLVSARLNLVHDCDEVYNYWEPLHFLLYGSGMQTWEYRCRGAALHLPLYKGALLVLASAGPVMLSALLVCWATTACPACPRLRSY